MRRFLIIFVLLLLPGVAYAQYYSGERATEQGFETSALHFQSHFLNTYGLYRFRDVAVGLIDDPFLDLQLNPANLPRIKKGAGLLYFDFRGDRTEPPVIDQYYGFVYDGPLIAPDPRYYRVTRQEPEPTFSFGLLAYPFRESFEKLFIGGTYQIIYQEEPYYTPPSWIYYSRYGYDPWGDYIGGDGQLPVEDRYYGEDELTTEAHLYSVFAGLPLSHDVDVGIGINGASHSRDGSYINLQSDDYTAVENREYEYYNERARDQEYDHFDINAGVRIELTRDLTAGLKVGHLCGEADQEELAVNVSHYLYNDSLVDDSWSYSDYTSYTEKRWNREGGTTYGRVSFEHELSREKRISAYYRYAQSDLDLHNGARIRDTSYYRWHHEWDDGGFIRVYNSRGNARVIDDRCGKGTREETTHQGMLNLKWELTEKSRTHVGFYFFGSETDLCTSEPVVADRLSDYYSTGSERRYYRLEEEKVIDWHNRIAYWTIQIPVMLQHEVNRHFAFTVGVNRILERWKVDDVTVTSWDRRVETDDGVIDDEVIAPQRDTQPQEKITEDYTAVLGSVEVTVSPDFIVRFLVEPETEKDFRINQWWLSFLVRL
ncbi:MAG TPA: hypothetical protein VM118_07255 [Acidobacteriota bacterium]|nr:hypothetical protein [Acidobacteriota bacterium]